MQLPKRNKSDSDRTPPDRRQRPDRKARAARAKAGTATLAARTKAGAGKLARGAKAGAGKLARGTKAGAGKLAKRVGALLAATRSWAQKRLVPPLAKAGRWLAGPLGAASRRLTPVRGVLIAGLGCAALLLLSQFADYRGVAIGAADVDPRIASVAPSPELEREEMGSAHGYAMVPVAVVAIAILLLAARTGRWQLCRLVALIGAAVIAVSFLVDRPIGLDESELARDFAAAEAQLLGGFWAQVFAGAGLVVTSLLLGGELRRKAGSPRRKRPKIDRRVAGVSRTRARRELGSGGYQR